MADVKISQLPASTTPLDGTEVLPIVQSATTKQVSVANLTAGRAVSALSLSLTNALPVTSGGTGLATTAAGTLLSSTALNTISATATPTLGVAGTTAGTLGLSGSTSGVVTLATQNTAGTWTMKLPTTAGTNNYLLKTDGSGNTDWVNPTALGIDLDVGTTAITGGTTGRVLYDNAGVLGEYSSVPVSFGGTGITSLTAGYIPYGNGTGAFGSSSGLFWDSTNSRLGVGTASPSYRLHVFGGNAAVVNSSGATFYIGQGLSGADYAELGVPSDKSAFNIKSDSTLPMAFWTNATERARIDSSGNWIVGDAATVYSDTKVTLKNTANTRNTVVWASNASLTADIFIVRADRNTTNNTFYAINYYNDGAGAYKFRVADSGDVTNSNGVYGQISDINLKENIVDATPKLNDLLSVKVKNFNFIGDNTKQIGVVAQELEKVFPSLVGTSVQDGVKSVKYSVFTPIIIKALQELAAKVSALEAKQ